MSNQINNISPSPFNISDAGKFGSEKTGSLSGGFGDLVKGVVKEAVDTSRASDSASIAAANGTINDLELVRVMTEAEISLQRFKTVYEATKQSVDKVLNMNL